MGLSGGKMRGEGVLVLAFQVRRSFCLAFMLHGLLYVDYCTSSEKDAMRANGMQNVVRTFPIV
jgi:hypothetical protein